MASVQQFRWRWIALAIVLLTAVASITIQIILKRQSTIDPIDLRLRRIAYEELSKFVELRDVNGLKYERLMADAPADADEQAKFRAEHVEPIMAPLWESEKAQYDRWQKAWESVFNRQPNATKIAWRRAWAVPASVAMVFAVCWLIRRLKSRRENGPPVG